MAPEEADLPGADSAPTAPIDLLTGAEVPLEGGVASAAVEAEGEVPMEEAMAAQLPRTIKDPLKAT